MSGLTPRFCISRFSTFLIYWHFAHHPACFLPLTLSFLAKIHTAYETQAFGTGNCFSEGISQFLSTHRCNAICHYLGLPPTSQPAKHSNDGEPPSFGDFTRLFPIFHVIQIKLTNFQVEPLSPLVNLSHMQPVDLYPRPSHDRMLPVAAATQCRLFLKTEISYISRECSLSCTSCLFSYDFFLSSAPAQACLPPTPFHLLCNGSSLLLSLLPPHMQPPLKRTSENLTSFLIFYLCLPLLVAQLPLPLLL